MKISELDTPALLVDLDRLEHNIERVSAYAREHDLRLRPHTKTHKTPEVGRMQVAAGAVGLTVAKVSEAEVMLDSGTPDLLVAYPVLGESKLGRLVEVARKTAVTVALDSVEAAEGLSRAAAAAGVEISVLVEADVGMQRCGLEPGPRLTGLAQQVDRLPALRLRGFAFYPGHIWYPSPEGPEELKKLAADVARVRADFTAAGLPLEIVSGGSSPTLFHSHEVAGVNEIRPGTVVFCDRMQVAAGVATMDDCAATILTTVISTPRDAFAVIDGGSKTFTSDEVRHTGDSTFGHVVEAPAARFARMNEEHGCLELDAVDQPIKIGDRLRIIPNHVCVAVNMHEKMYAVRGDEVEATWTVRGRGKLQ